jgi:hypothetical protein
MNVHTILIVIKIAIALSINSILLMPGESVYTLSVRLRNGLLLRWRQSGLDRDGLDLS